MCFWIFDTKQSKEWSKLTNNQSFKKKLKTWNQQSSVCFTQLRTIQDRYVRLLVVHVNEFKRFDFIFHQITDEVIENLYVLGFWVLNKIPRKIYDTSVVTKHTYRFLRNPIVMKKFLHSKKLSTTSPSSYILAFPSAVDRDTKFCFLLIHETRLFLR